MLPITREIIKGMASGLGFLVFEFVLDAPLLLSAAIGAGLYVGLSFLLPKSSDTKAPAVGLTIQERDAFLAACRKSVSDLERLATSVSKHSFAERVKALAKMADELADYLEKKPDAILMAYAVPRNLDHLVSMLQQYVAICRYQQAGETAGEALRKVEDIFEAADKSFSGMYQQLVDNDAAALEASANTLAILMDADAEVLGRRARMNELPKEKKPQLPGAQRHKEKQS
jgi:hypothetical protein